jgi:hypothetical protein
MRLMLDPAELARAQELSAGQPEAWKAFRRQRVRAFRAYLNDLRLDFRRLEFKLRYLLLAAPASDALWVHRLNRVRARFAYDSFALEFRLILFSWGVGTVNVSGLLDTIEQMEKVLEPKAFGASA